MNDFHENVGPTRGYIQIVYNRRKMLIVVLFVLLIEEY